MKELHLQDEENPEEWKCFFVDDLIEQLEKSEKPNFLNALLKLLEATANSPSVGYQFRRLRQELVKRYNLTD